MCTVFRINRIYNLCVFVLNMSYTLLICICVYIMCRCPIIIALFPNIIMSIYLRLVYYIEFIGFAIFFK